MGTFATVTMQISGSIPAIAQDVVAVFPGTRKVDVDPAGTSVTFELHFPGRLSALVDRLNNRRIVVGPVATVSIPVTSLVPALLTSPEHVNERLSGGSEVWDPEFPRGSYVSEAKLVGDHVEATIVPSTDAMHQLYDAMYTLGLVALEAGQPLGVH